MKQKLEGLDFVRAAACFGILFFHIHVTYTGFISVAAFFALSGFLMTYNALGREETEAPTLKSSIAFSLKRTRKFYGLYLITLIIPLFEQLYGIVNGLGKLDGQLIMRIVTNVLLVQSLVPDVNTGFFMNGVAWYLSTAMFLYIAFPYILSHLRKRRSRKEAWCVILVTYLLQIAGGFFVNEFAEKHMSPDYLNSAGFMQWIEYISPFSRIADFIIACNFAYLFRNRRKTERTVGTATVLECAAIISAIASELLFEKKLIPDYLCYSSVFIPAVSLLIWEFARGEGYISRAMNNPVVHFISDLSPYIFLIHCVVIMVMTFVINRLPLPFRLRQYVFLFVVPAAIILCSMAYRALEKKIKSKKTA